jgi:hypothetical protein
VLGSSLMVMSGLRFVHRAQQARIPVAIVNRGATRGDPLADIKSTPRSARYCPPWLAPPNRPGQAGEVSAWADGHQRDSERRPPRGCFHLRPPLAGTTASATIRSCEALGSGPYAERPLGRLCDRPTRAGERGKAIVGSAGEVRGRSPGGSEEERHTDVVAYERAHKNRGGVPNSAQRETTNA